MSEEIISHAEQNCQGNIKYDAAMLLSYRGLSTVFSTIYTAFTLKAKPWSSRGEKQVRAKIRNSNPGMKR